MKHRPAGFPLTSLTLLSNLRGEGIGSQAWQEFDQAYRPAVQAYFRACDAEEAEDLTQEFFVKVLLSGKLLRSYDRNKGRFTPFLKRSLRNFWIGHLRRRSKITKIRPDQIEEGWDIVNVVRTGPDEELDAAWARTLVHSALQRVERICCRNKQQLHLELFIGRYLSDSSVRWGELGARVGLGGKAARHLAETVARHLKEELRKLIGEQSGSGKATDEEILRLLACLEQR